MPYVNYILLVPPRAILRPSASWPRGRQPCLPPRHGSGSACGGSAVLFSTWAFIASELGSHGPTLVEQRETVLPLGAVDLGLELAQPVVRRVAMLSRPAIRHPHTTFRADGCGMAERDDGIFARVLFGAGLAFA
jgi:hypothetical protein